MHATLETPAISPVNGHSHNLAPAPSVPAAPIGQTPQPKNLPHPPIVFFRGIPTVRDREIFRQVVICRRTKTDVARQYQLSQPRVTQICGEVQEWMQEHSPRQTEELTQPQWLNLAENLCRQRLETQYALAMEALEASRGPRQWQGWDCEGNRVEKRPEPGQGSPCALLNLALKTTIELARLDGVWGSGDAWAGRNREKLADFRQQNEAEWDAETAANQAVLEDRQAAEAERAYPAAATEAPAVAESAPNAAYDRLCALPPAEAPAAEVAEAASGASDAASELCSEAPERNLVMDLVADRLKRAYAPQGAPLPDADEQFRRVPPAEREKSFRRRRQREKLLAPLAQPMNGHAASTS